MNKFETEIVRKVIVGFFASLTGRVRPVYYSATRGTKRKMLMLLFVCLEQAGMVLCQLRDCPKPECENPIRTRDDCCPVCPGESFILLLSSRRFVTFFFQNWPPFNSFIDLSEYLSTYLT